MCVIMNEDICEHNGYLSLLGIMKFSRIIPVTERKRVKKISPVRKDDVLTMGHGEVTEVVCNTCKKQLTVKEVKSLTGITLYKMPTLEKESS